MDKQTILDLVAKQLADQDWYYRSFTSRCNCCPSEYSYLTETEITEFVSDLSIAIDDNMEANNG